MPKRLIVLFLCLMPSTLAAERILFRELVTVPVRQIDANRFEVFEADGAGGTQMWCAAGIFSRDVLGIRSGTLAVAQSRGPSASSPGRMSVVFTTQPVKDPKQSYSTSVRIKGLTFSTATARAQCRAVLPEQVIRVRVLSP